MAPIIIQRFDYEALQLESRLPTGPRVAVLGSTDFWHNESERTCSEIGRLLAAIPDLLLITGGVEGIGEAIGRSFFQARRQGGKEARVYHVLPNNEEAWDYGETYFAGSDMTERREILGRLSRLFLIVEGGPRTLHEVEVAFSRNAAIIPVGRSGGQAAELYARLPRPAAIDESTWSVLGAKGSTPEETALAVVRAVQSCL
jgi:hypothetical protein